jgi:tyrosyl-tRNA synthetase
MGGSLGGSGSGSSSRASSQSYQSSLANTQEKILKQREEFFQSYYLPEFKELYSSMTPDSEAGKAQMGLTANQINQSFDAAQKQTNQMIAQRNLADSGAGAALTAQNNRAKASALAKAYAEQRANSTNLKATTLANFGTLMPSTTQAAPVLSNSTSSSSSWGFSGNAAFQL